MNNTIKNVIVLGQDPTLTTVGMPLAERRPESILNGK